MTDSAISAAVISSQDTASNDDRDYGDVDLYAGVPVAQDSTSLGHSLTTSHSDYVRIPSFSTSRYPQRDPAGYRSS